MRNLKGILRHDKITTALSIFTRAAKFVTSNLYIG